MVVEVHAEMEGGPVLVGRLYPHRRGRIESATFAYDDSWIASPDAYPLEPQLDLRSGSFQTVTGRALFGCFTDSAPDRWGRLLIRRAERRRAVGSGAAERTISEIDLVLGVRDDLRQGALRFRPVGATEFVANEASAVPHLHDLRELLAAAGRAERDRADDDDYDLLLRAGSSLGGARPKAHVGGSDGQIAIAKFPSAVDDDWEVMAWEKVALDLADLAGLATPRADLHRVGRQRVLVVDRFDRTSSMARIGYVSARTMLEARDGDTHSYLEIAESIEQVSPSPTDDMHELWGRIAFSILISNTDDHLRNHGFLRAGRGGWRLSPLFDVNPNPEPGPKHLSTAIDLDDTQASIETLMRVAPNFRVNEYVARETLGRVSNAVGQWRAVAQRNGIAARELAVMESAFDEEQRRTARHIAAS